MWYSQEARAYGLFVLLAALAMLCFLRALRDPTAARMAAFALSGALALLSHYFAVFLLIPMVMWLLWAHADRLRALLPAIGALALVGLALLPLISAQGGHGTQWIGAVGALEPPAGDPAVLPHRLLRRRARARHRAARRAADPRRHRLRPVARAEPRRGARRADRR